MKHWTDEELLDRLYGLGPDDDHLDSCGECRERFDRLESRRAALAAEPPVPPAFLASQRQSVMRRATAGSSQSLILRAAAACAAVTVLAVGLLMNRSPERPVPQEVASVSDAQLFAEISTVVADNEPRAAAPIRELFEEAQ